jgi:hypothetical protein
VLRRLRTIVIGAFLLGAALPVSLAMTATVASADAVITVTTTNDGGPGSLRQAFADAVTNGVSDGLDTTIELTPGEYDLTDCTGVFDGGSLLYNAPQNDLTLIGHGSTIRQRCPGVSIIIDLSTTGSLTVQGVWLTGADSRSSGGAISGSNSGGLTVIDSTISGNSAAVGGGGISDNGPVTIVNSTITGNSVVGGITGGGIYLLGGDLTLVYSTVVDNAGLSPGFGAANILLSQGDLTSFGSVVGLPRAAKSNCSMSGTTVSHGYNFSDDSSCGFAAATDRQDAGDPGLLDLADNGGGTPTMATSIGGPLVDKIPEAACQSDGASSITTDQRGIPRPGETLTSCGPPIPALHCDIGAFEEQYFLGPACAAPRPQTPPVIAPRFTG